MLTYNRLPKNMNPWICIPLVLFSLSITPALGDDLSEVQQRGVLRHLGVPYANFVTGSGDGMDVELMQRFAKYLGVKYEYVQTKWSDVISDVSGKKFKASGTEVEFLGQADVRGDVIANGLTILPWRQKVVDYSEPVFPTQVWLIARADSKLQPIKPSGDAEKDIAAVKALLKDCSVLCKAKTCLDPTLHGLDKCGAKVKLFDGTLNELAPAIINGDAETTILDVPDSLVALQKWPGRIKVIGPISKKQQMGCAFSKSSPELRKAFNQFMTKCKEDGTYLKLVEKYYPTVFEFYPDFFAPMRDVAK